MDYKWKVFRLEKIVPPVLAVGAELKNTICLTKDNQAYLSEPLGDLENYQDFCHFEKAIVSGLEMLGIEPELIAYDLHPDYLSTKLAMDFKPELSPVGVQHHHAHLAACLADNGTKGPAIGVTFDGTGYGSDDCIWGGEFLVGSETGFQRWAHLAYLPLPSGSMAIREPWRMGAQYLFQVFGDRMGDLSLKFVEELPDNWSLLQQATARGINAPLTSSCGRLFDGVAAVVLPKLGQVAFEAEAAISLERIAEPEETGKYAVDIGCDLPFQLGWYPLWEGIVADLEAGLRAGVISARFHNTLAGMIVEVCLRIRMETAINQVALTGGVFQNRFLLQKAVEGLNKAGFKVMLHDRLPPNDSGIALGQAMIAAAKE
jgi:hydrogenase maturation protein HypF